MKKVLALILSFAMILTMIQIPFVISAEDTTENVVTVYVSTLGSDAAYVDDATAYGDGTAEHPYLTIAKAEAAIEADTTATAGKIILVDTGTDATDTTAAVPATYTYSRSEHSKLVTITAEDSTTILKFADKTLGGPIHLENLYTNGNLYCGGFNITVGDNVNSSSATRLYLGHGVKNAVRDGQEVYIQDFDNQGGWTYCTIRIGYANTTDNSVYIVNGDTNIYVEKIHSHQFLMDGGTFNGNVNFVIEKGMTVRSDGNYFAFEKIPVITGALQLVLNNGVKRNSILNLANIRTKAPCDYYIIEGAKATDGSYLTTTETAGIFKVNGNMVANAYKIDITSETAEDGTVTYTETVSDTAVKSKGGILDLSDVPGEYSVVYTQPTAEENEDLVVYVDAENGSDVNDGKTIDTAFATIDRAQNWLNMSTAEGEKIIYIKGKVDFDGGEPHTEMMTLKGYDATAELNYVTTHFTISTGGGISAAVLQGPTTFDGLITEAQGEGIGYSYLVSGAHEFIVKNGKDTGWFSHNYYLGPVAQTSTDKRTVATLENLGGDYGTSNSLHFGALNNTNKTSAGVDFLMKNGKLLQFFFLNGTTFTGDVNLVFDGFSPRGDQSGSAFVNNGSTFNAALHIVFNNNMYSLMNDTAKTNLKNLTAQDGVWVINAEKASDGTLLRTTENAGIFAVDGNLVANAYKVVDGVQSETVVKSVNGLLDLSGIENAGFYNVVFTTRDAEVNNDTVVYVSDAGKDINDGKTIDTAFGTIEFAEKWLNASAVDGDKTIIFDGTVQMLCTVAHEDMFIYKAYDSDARLSRVYTTYTNEVYGLQELKGPTTLEDVTLVNGNLPIYTCGYPMVVKAAPDNFAVWVGNFGKGDAIANRESFVYDSAWDYWDNMYVYIGGNGSAAKTVNGADIHLVQGELNKLQFGKYTTFTDDVNIVFDRIRKRGDGYGGLIDAGSNNVFEKGLQIIFNNGQKEWLKDDANRTTLEGIKANGGSWIMYCETAADGTLLRTTDTAGIFKVEGGSYAKAVNNATGDVVYSENGLLTLDAGIYTVTYQKTLLSEGDRPFDITGDNKVNALDLTAVIKALLKATDISIFDANNDGESDIRDLVALKVKLSAADFLESELANTYKLLKNENKLTIGYIGGSITYGDSAKSVIENGTVVSKDGDISNSYVNRVSNWFKTQYPNATIETVNAGVSNTHSYLGLYRLEETLMNTDGHDMPDLVFIEYTTNDWGDHFGIDSIKSFVESLVLNVRSINPYADIVILSTNISGTNNAVVNAHKEVAEHYGLPFIDVGTPLRNAMVEATGKGSESEGTFLYTADNLHPSALGYEVYFNTIRPVLEDALTGIGDNMYNYVQNAIPTLCDNLVLNPVAYDGNTDGVTYSEGCTTTSISVSMHNTLLAELVNMPVVDAGVKVPANGTISATFSGNYVGVLAVVTADGLPLQYQIDNGEWQEFDLTSHRYYHTNAFMLASGLGEGEHTITIKVLRDTTLAILG